MTADEGAARKPLRIGACPQCGQSTRLDPSNDWRPFCSERCKLIDLGGWFEERYRVPGDEISDSSEDLDPTRR